MLTKRNSFSPIIGLFNENETPCNLSELESSGCKIYLPHNKRILQFGEYVHGLYLLTQGRVNACFLSPQGGKFVIFTLKPLCIFGEAPFFNRSESTLEFEVCSQSTLIYFDKNSVENLLVTNPFFKELLLKSIVTKAQISVEHLSDIYNLSPEQRVCKYLEYLCLDGLKPSENIYTLNITQDEIAFSVGLSRVTVARVYSHLRDHHILDNSYKSKKRLTVYFDNLLKYNSNFC